MYLGCLLTRISEFPVLKRTTGNFESGSLTIPTTYTVIHAWQFRILRGIISFAITFWGGNTRALIVWNLSLQSFDTYLSFLVQVF